MDYRGGFDGASPVYDEAPAYGGYSGQQRINRFRRMMDDRGRQYAEDFFVYTAQVGAIAAGGTAFQTINIEKHSAFEALAFVGGSSTGATVSPTPQSQVDVTLMDGASSRNLMNARVPLFNCAGFGQQPFILPIPRRFMPQSQLTVAFHNYATAQAVTGAQFSMIGRKIFQSSLPGQGNARFLPSNEPAELPRFHTWQDEDTGRWYSEDLYMYDAPLASITNGTTTPVQFLIEGDSDFEWIMSTFSMVDNGPVVRGPTEISVRVQIEDGGAQRKLFGGTQPAGTQFNGIDAAQVTGISTFPFILRQPRIFLAKTPVTVTFLNLSGVTLTELHHTMIGRKIFELD